MLILQDHLGLLCCPKHEVASLTPEIGRFRCVLADGSVAHRPGPWPEGPWVALGPSRVHPAHLRTHPDGYQDPAGFTYPAASLPSIPIPPPTPCHPELPWPPDDIYLLRGEGGQALWLSDQGEFAAGMYAAQAAQLHPHMAPAGRGTYVNLRRLRRIFNERKRFRLVLDNGVQLTVSYGPHEKLCQALGLPHLYFLEPCLQAQYREGLRDYPVELKVAAGDWLRSEFGNSRRLIANILWQVVLWRRQGRSEVQEYGREHRGFFYDPLRTPLHRAGFETALRHLPDFGLDEADLLSFDPGYRIFQEVAGTLIGEDRLFTYQELGFEDPRPDLRSLGSRRPDRLLLAEKQSLARYTRQMGEELGISTLIMGGIPSLLSTEYFVQHLKGAGVEQIEVAAYGDFDPGGWIAAKSFVDQCERYALKVRSLEYLVVPECFTQEELALHSMPIPVTSPQIEGKIKAWLAESGGIEGRAESIGADHLKPLDRLRRRLAQVFR